MGQYPKLIDRAANNYEPHLICYFLRELSASFHGYYNNEKFLVEDEELMKSRLFLLKGIKQVIQNGLRVLGQRAPEEMWESDFRKYQKNKKYNSWMLQKL